MNKINKKRIGFIILFFLIFIIFLLQNNNKKYDTLDKAIHDTLKEKDVLKVYEYDNEAFVVIAPDSGSDFKYYYKEDNKWNVGIYGCPSLHFNDEFQGPGMRYYRSSNSNRVYVAISPKNGPIYDEYKNIEIKDNLNSDFYMTKYDNGFVNWHTVIELKKGEKYKVYINDEEYEIDYESLTMKNAE